MHPIFRKAAQAGVFWWFAWVTGCVRPTILKTPDAIAAKPTPCPGEFAWPDWSETFEKFASDRQFMHRYLFNGDEIWPKNIDFCARARNSLLDLANGPGTSLELGLAGSAWEGLTYTVAFTNAFRRFSDPVTGSDWLYIWPVISDRTINDLRVLLELEENPDPASTMPRHLVLPRILGGTAREQWPESDQDDLQGAWNRRMTGALVRRLTRQAGAMGWSFSGFSFAKGADRVRFYARLDGLAPPERRVLLENFLKELELQAARKNLLFPAHRIQREMENLVFFRLEGYPDPVSPAVVRMAARRDPSAELMEALAKLDYLSSGKWSGTEEIPAGWPVQREQYVKLRSELEAWQERISAIARSPSLREAVFSQLERNPVILSGNVYFATSHLEESATGYTHVGLVLNLPSRPGEPWLFDRVQAFFYANAIRTLQKSALVELVRPDMKVVNKPRRYAVLPYRVHAPIQFSSGSTDVINFFNMYTDWARNLPEGYRLGPEFLWGAVHLLPHLPQNRDRLRRFQYLKKIGEYSYIDYLNMRPLAGQDLHLIARCAHP